MLRDMVELTLNALARADLVLPLSGHDLGVGAGDVDAGVQAGLVVGVDDVAAEDLAGADTAVVGALGPGEAVLGPAIGPAVDVEERVLLLEAEPKLLRGVRLHKDVGVAAEVIRVGLAVGAPRLAHDEDVVTETERVRVEGDGAEVDIGIVAGRLARRRAVEVPLWQLIHRGGLLGERLRRALALFALVHRAVIVAGVVTAGRPPSRR